MHMSAQKLVHEKAFLKYAHSCSQTIHWRKSNVRSPAWKLESTRQAESIFPCYVWPMLAWQLKTYTTKKISLWMAPRRTEPILLLAQTIRQWWIKLPKIPAYFLALYHYHITTFIPVVNRSWKMTWWRGANGAIWAWSCGGASGSHCQPENGQPAYGQSASLPCPAKPCQSASLPYHASPAKCAPP